MESLRTSILVTADARGVAAGLAPALVAFNQFESRAVRAFTRAGQVLDTLGPKRFAGFAIGAAGVLLLTQALVGALGPAIRFEDAFAGVLKTVDGTPEQLNEIRSEILGLAREMPIAATELANIAAAAGQLGVQANRVTEFTRVVAELAATTDLGFDGAARNLARFLNVVDGGVQNVDAVSNVLVDLGNNFATTESQILTFATRLGPAFSAAGATSEEILAIATAFSALGIQAELGGSALNRVITTIADAARIGDGRLRIFAETAGILPETFRSIARENPVEAFRLFVNGLGEMQAANNSITPTLEALSLGGIRVTQVLTTAANQTGILTSSLQLADRALSNNNARQIEYARRAETTASRILVLQNRLRDLAITAGTPLLDGFVAIIDRLGDEIVKVTDNVGPLGSALVDTLENLAGALQSVDSAFGDGGALDAASDLLIGLSVAAGAALNAINALGPAGPILVGLAVAFTRIPISANAAGVALSRFGASTQVAQIGTGRLTGALFLLQGALKFVPSLIGVFALIELGNAISEANRKAEEAAATFRGEFREALEGGDYDGVTRQIAATREEIERLEDLDRVPEGLSSGFDGWRNSLISTFQILTPFTENTMLNARNEAEALRDEMDNLGVSTREVGDSGASAASGMGAFEVRIARMADRLGLTKDGVLTLATEMGLLEAITSGTAEEFFAAGQQLEDFGFRAELAGTGFQSLRLKVLEGSATLEDIADGLDLSVEGLIALDAASDSVDLDKMFDGEPEEKLAALDLAAAALAVEYSGLASAVGVSNDAFILQDAAVKTLASSLSALESAIQRARDIQEQAAFQQNLLADATDRYEKALANVREGLSTEELEEYANAVLDLTIAQAANASTEEEALAIQARLRQSFIDTALAAGVPADEVLRLATEILGLPPSTIIEIQARGLEVAERVERINEQLDALDRQIFIRMGIVDQATGQIRIAQEAADEFATRRYEAFLEANGVPAETRARMVEEFINTQFERNFIATMDVETRDALAKIAGVTAEALTYDDILAIADTDANTELATNEILALALLINNEINKEFVAGLTAEDRGVLAAIAGVEPALFNFADLVAIADLDADGTPAESEIFAVTQFLNEYGDIVAEALLKADGVPASEVIAGLMEELGFFDQQEPEANPKVDPTDVDEEMQRLNAAMDGFALQEPEANPQVDPTDVDEDLQRLNAAMDGFALRAPEAELRTDPTDAALELADLNQRLDDYEARRPNPTVTANTSQADRVLGGVVALLGQIRSKEVTVTTRTRTISGGGSSATFSQHGAIRRYERGGLNMLPSPTGTAQIYAPAPPGSVRIHSEPTTGGESYIPLGRQNRQRSLKIFAETGKLIGAPGFAAGAIVGRPAQAFQSGGIRQAVSTAAVASDRFGSTVNSTTIQMSPNISISVTGGSSVPPQEIGRVVRQEVMSVMRQASRDFTNQNPH